MTWPFTMSLVCFLAFVWALDRFLAVRAEERNRQ